MDERLRAVFARVFGASEIDDSTSLMTLPEWDSLGHITLILELEAEFKVSIAASESADMIDVAEIKRTITAKLASGS